MGGKKVIWGIRVYIGNVIFISRPNNHPLTQSSDPGLRTAALHYCSQFNPAMMRKFPSCPEDEYDVDLCLKFPAVKKLSLQPASIVVRDQLS